MSLLLWDSSYSVNHTIMDADHKKLFKISNDLSEAMKGGQSKTVLERLLNDLENYTKDHFYREEQYLKEGKYPDLATQTQQHKLFIEKIIEFKASFQNGDKIVALKMLQFINDWLVNHIMKVDMKYKAEVATSSENFY